jgi:hypothetical protein
LISVRVARFLVLSAVLTAAACTDPVDKAAKKRIFSPEDPPKAVASAAERLPVEDLPRDPKLVGRVLGMSAGETTERLGPHTWTATVQFEWTGPKVVKLEETRTLVSGRGGVEGDFYATLENSRDQGLEVIRVGGQVYARSRYGKFRHRRRDRGVAERERDEVHGALREMDRIFRGRIALKPLGTVTHQGRTAWKYDVDLASASPQPSRSAALPPPQYAKGGLDPDTQRRLRFTERAEAQSLDGELLVDALTSVVLSSRLEGTVSAPDEANGTATLRLQVASETTDIGKDPRLAAPAEFLPDEDKPQGIADALDQFGIPRGEAADAGTAVLGRKPKPGVASDAPEDEG